MIFYRCNLVPVFGQFQAIIGFSEQGFDSGPLSTAQIQLQHGPITANVHLDDGKVFRHHVVSIPGAGACVTSEEEASLSVGVAQLIAITDAAI
jgi:hypothetical protein